MYTLVNRDGEMVCKVICLACGMAKAQMVVDGMVGFADSKCHDMFLHHSEMRTLVANRDKMPTFTAVFTAQALLKYYALDLKPGALIAEIDCDNIQHNHQDIAHAVGDVRLVKTHHFDVDFLKAHMPLELDMMYDIFILNAITYCDATMAHFLWQTHLDNKALHKSLFLAFLTCRYVCRTTPEHLLQFVISMDILDEISVLILALSQKIPYHHYLPSNFPNLEDNLGYDLLFAISCCNWTDQEAWQILQELVSRGFSINARMLQGRPCHLTNYESDEEMQQLTSVRHVSVLRYVMESGIAIEPETLEKIFVRCFQSYTKADWRFFPEDLAKSYVMSVIKKVDPGSFREYLQIWPRDRTEYEPLFVDIMDKHEEHSKILLEMIDLTPELRIKCQNSFIWPQDTTTFSMDYVKFLTQDLGIDIGTLDLMRAVVNVQIKPECLIWLLENHHPDQTDRNRRFAKTEIYSAQNRHPVALSNVEDLTLIEVIFYHLSQYLNVERMASDLNLELDYDSLCKILCHDIYSQEYDCKHTHETCRFINMANHECLYAVMKCLHFMQPTDTFMAEIWSAVVTVYPEADIDPKPKSHVWYQDRKICRDYYVDNIVHNWTQLVRNDGSDFNQT